MKTTLVGVEQINHDVSTFWLKPENPLRYTAGQYIEMYLPHNNPDERGQKHWFTLSASPTEELISITTKFAGKNSSTFKKTLFSLNPGVEVQISEPMGDFVLPKDLKIPLVFVAGGIGVTPFRSIIKWLFDTSETRSIQVILAASTKADIVFAKLFNEYGAGLSEVTGERLTAKKIIQLIGGSENKRFYVSGPEPMVEELEADLQKNGVGKDQLIGDFFPGYPHI